MRQPGAHVLASGVPPMQTLPLASITLCGEQPPGGLGQSALQHAPPAPGAAFSLGQPRPSGREFWLAGNTGLFSTRTQASRSR